MSENKETISVENEPVKKKKSRFGKVVGVLIVVLAVTFSFLALSQKDHYTVLDSTSKEVTSKISKIKDYRKLKGYKVLEDNGKHKLILISAGLTYDEFATIEVLDVKIDKNKADVTIKENINKNPEREVVKYPFIILKVDTSVDKLDIKNESGEEYIEIVIDGEETEEIKEETQKVEDTEESASDEKVEETEDSEESKNEDEIVEDNSDVEDKEQSSENIKELTCVFRGRVDLNSIEVSVGESYRTFNVEMVQDAFKDKEIGDTITVEYIESDMGQKIVKVK